jgi:EpsI family protein
VTSHFISNQEDYTYTGTKVISDFAVPGWQGRELPNNDKILSALETDSTIFKEFFNKKGGFVTLYVGHYRQLEKAKMSHSPMVCFTAQGWVMSNVGHLSIDSGIPLNCTMMIVKKGERKELVYYWYQFDKKTFSDIYEMKLALLAKRLRGESEDNLFIRLTTPIENGVESASQVLNNFFQVLEPEIEKCFFNKKQ